MPATAADQRRCRECGCTEDNACLTSEDAGMFGYLNALVTGGSEPRPCWWVEEDLCSGCAYGTTVRGPVQAEDSAS